MIKKSRSAVKVVYDVLASDCMFFISMAVLIQLLG
jgi:hypothetical protein